MLQKTQEQKLIIKHALTGNNLCIQALAGSGKTSTLVMVALELNKPSLYLAYNKAMAEEAKTKFPDSVEVRTTHSLAYKFIGHKYQHKLTRPRGKYINVCGTGGEIARYFGIKSFILDEESSITPAAIGLLIKDTVNRFEYSDDKVLEKKHINFSLIKEFSKKRGWDNFVEMKIISECLSFAKKLWKMRTDINNEILCTHDTYLKLYQLSDPVLDGYDVIYADEFQDANSCFLDVFCKQKAQLIAVGDSFQSIYQWRGSINALDKLDFDELMLSQSFRFGPIVAELASKILIDNKGQQLATVKGFDVIDSTISGSPKTLEGKQYTVLFRSNAALLEEAVYLLEQGKRCNIETDMQDFVRKLESAEHLFANNMKDVKHEEIVPFTSWYELKSEAKVNGEFSRIVRLVEDGLVKHYISILESHRNVAEPNVTLTTAHKSKGREWDVVMLADDFPSNYNEKGKWVGMDDQERNLLYVAVTRAKKHLVYNTTVLEFLGTVGDYPFSSGLKVNVKALVHVDQYNIHKLPAFIDKNIGEHAHDAVLRGIDELDLLESYERGELSQEFTYDTGIIDSLGYSAYSGDLYK